jgi:UDP-N-acetylmuramate dehydrogenase
MQPAPEPNVPLARFTTWKIGGPADWLLLPETEPQLLAGLEWARSRGLPVHLLGRGSNVLIADAGLRGMVICLRHFAKDAFRIEPAPDGSSRLEVSAGMSLPRLAKVAAHAGFGGYEFYIGIPGTVGGAVVINAGFGPGDPRETARRCSAVRLLGGDGAIRWEPYARFRPRYRHTGLLDTGDIVLAARFALRQRASPAEIRAITAEHLALRRARQPLTRPTAGSVFKGTADGTPAAVLIDRCGLKGLRVGDALVSPKHANWIENLGKASAADVLALIRQVQDSVEAREGVRLVPEVRVMGVD